MLALENGEPAAFILFDLRGRGATIHQACACVDVRRRHLAQALVDEVRRRAGAGGAAVVRLACAENLHPALAFWQAVGFTPYARIPGGKARGRQLVLFENRVLNPVQPNLIALPRVANGKIVGESGQPAAGSGQPIRRAA